MDQQRDYEPFRRLVMRMCTTLDKFATDELIETWWKSLRTVPFAGIERRIDAFLASATEKTKFPRPAQFRPDDLPSYDPRDEARDKRIAEDSRRTWNEFIDRFPHTGPIRSKMALCSQIMAKEHESSPIYNEALTDWLALEKLLGANGVFSADR